MVSDAAAWADAIWRRGIAPDALLTIDEWADRYRVLPPSSAEPGPWRTDRLPFLREIMRELAATGIGILLVTHHLADIIPEIERVIALRDGRIVADDPKNQILTPASLAEIFGVPVEIVRRDGFYHLW